MPNYTFRDETTGVVYIAEGMTIAAMEQFLEENPNVKWVPTNAIAVLDSVRIGVKKPDENFRDLLKTIKKGSPGSTVKV